MNKYMLMLLFSCLFASSAAAALKPMDAAPTFSLRDSDGNDFNLSDYVGAAKKDKGTGVILSFFASWCGQCRNELPLINSLVDELKIKGIKVVLIDVKEDVDTIGVLLTELKVDKPIVLSDRYGKVAEKYQVRFLPTTFFIAADGKIKDIVFGDIENAQKLRDSTRKF